MQAYIFDINYEQDPAARFAHLLRDPYTVFLDSSKTDKSNQQGQYSYICTRPIETIETYGSSTNIRTYTGSGAQTTSQENPFNIIKQRLAFYSEQFTSP